MLIKDRVDHLKKSAAVATKRTLFSSEERKGRTNERTTRIYYIHAQPRFKKNNIPAVTIRDDDSHPTLFLSSPRITRKRQSWPALRFGKPVSSSIFVFAPRRLFHQMIEINDFFRGLFGDHAKEMQTRDSFARWEAT